MKRRVGETRDEALARHKRQANSKGIARGMGFTFLWIANRIGQFTFYAFGVFTLFHNNEPVVGLLLIICGLLLRLTLFVARTANVIVASNVEAMIRITDPEAANDELEPPRIW